MPKYKKKITRQMNFEEVREAIQDLPEQRRAFIAVLYFSACRISEAISIRANDINCTPDMIYVQILRLKGSAQTDPTPLPRVPELEYLCKGHLRPFTFSRSTGYRIVKKTFPQLYPHYFRMNRITKIMEKFGDATVYNYVGICAQSIDHYRGKVNIGKVGKALWEETK